MNEALSVAVAVVGAGAAGSYAAWRLAGPDVALFEGDARAGGRLRTERISLRAAATTITSIQAELGAARYLPKEHPRVAALVEKLRPPSDFASIAQMLVTQFQERGGAFFPNYFLESISKETGEGDSALMLRFSNPRSGAPLPTVLAEKAILAFGSRAFELIDLTAVDPANHFRSGLLTTVVPRPASKLVLLYRVENGRPWWSGMEVALFAAADGVQDQLYPGEMSADGRYGSLVLYSKYQSALSWNACLLPREKSYDGFTLLDGSHEGSKQMLDRAKAELAAICGLSRIPPPVAGAYMDWTADPYGGAWHSWRPGVNPEDVIAKMTSAPFSADVPIYVCGEAWSRRQGWVEGALESAEMVLQRSFGLPPAL